MGGLRHDGQQRTDGQGLQAAGPLPAPAAPAPAGTGARARAGGGAALRRQQQRALCFVGARRDGKRAGDARLRLGRSQAKLTGLAAGRIPGRAGLVRGTVQGAPPPASGGSVACTSAPASSSASTARSLWPAGWRLGVEGGMATRLLGRMEVGWLFAGGRWAGTAAVCSTAAHARDHHPLPPDALTLARAHARPRRQRHLGAGCSRCPLRRAGPPPPPPPPLACSPPVCPAREGC